MLTRLWFTSNCKWEDYALLLFYQVCDQVVSEIWEVVDGQVECQISTPTREGSEDQIREGLDAY